MNRLTQSLPLREPARTLVFGPLAWLKLQFFCHAGETEIGGFAISAEDNLLYIEDFQTIRQEADFAAVRFDDAAVADFFDACVDRGLAPERFARIWCHTHPGKSVEPSLVDEETFCRTFGTCHWSLMFILGRTGLTYARLAFSAGPRGQMCLPVDVDWSAWPKVMSDRDALQRLAATWQQEYATNVKAAPRAPCAPTRLHDERLAFDRQEGIAPAQDPWWDREPWSRELDEMTYSPIEKDSDYE